VLLKHDCSYYSGDFRTESTNDKVFLIDYIGNLKTKRVG